MLNYWFKFALQTATLHARRWIITRCPWALSALYPTHCVRAKSCHD